MGYFTKEWYVQQGGRRWWWLQRRNGMGEPRQPDNNKNPPPLPPFWLSTPTPRHVGLLRTPVDTRAYRGPSRTSYNPTLRRQRPKHQELCLSPLSSCRSTQIPPLPARHAFRIYTHVTGTNPNYDIVFSTAVSGATETDPICLRRSHIPLVVSHFLLYFNGTEEA